jgi:DNA-binding NarL/FixJ family response regulator
VLRADTGVAWPPEDRLLHEPLLVTTRSRLDNAAFEAAFAEGKAMNLADAVKYALSEEEADPATTAVPKEPSASEPIGMLTGREQEVAALMAKELTNRQVASYLTLSEHTVATHIRNILKKLGLHSRTQIAAYFREQH